MDRRWDPAASPVRVTPLAAGQKEEGKVRWPWTATEKTQPTRVVCVGDGITRTTLTVEVPLRETVWHCSNKKVRGKPMACSST
jgi:hypothetical protein